MRYWLVLFLILFATSAEATTWWVAASGGSTGNCSTATGATDPSIYLRTIAAAKDCVGHALGAGAGHTIKIKPGTYNEQLMTNDPSSRVTGLVGNPFTIEASTYSTTPWINTPTVVIVNSNPIAIWEGYNPAEIAASANRDYYTVFRGLKFDCTNSSAGACLSLWVYHITLEYNDWNHPEAGTQDLNGHHCTGGIMSFSTVRGNYIHNCASRQHNRGYGWYHSGSDTLFEGNRFENIGGTGIQQYCGDCIARGYPQSRNVYRRNTFYNTNNAMDLSDNPGISCQTLIISEGTDNEIYDNLLVQNYPGLPVGQAWIAIEDWTGTNRDHIYNNTIVGYRGFGGSSPYPAIQLSSSNNAVVRNNFIYDSTDAIGLGTNTTVSHNLCLNNSSNSNCQITSGTAGFVDAANGNFQLVLGSSAIDAGTNLGAPYNLDIAGINRDTQGGAGWDIGAYERQITAPPVAGNELVLALAFDEGKGTTTVDSSGKKHTVTLNNVTWDTGIYGASLRFNGTNSSVVVANSANFNLSNMTLEAWVAPLDLVNPYNFVAVIYKGSLNQSAWGLYAKSDTYMCPNLTAMGYFSNTINNFACSTAQIFTGGTAWTHIAYTFDGTNSRFYHNGALVATQAASESMINNNGDLQIGTSVYNEWFNGWIDEVRVYNYARSPAEIATDYNTPILQQAPGAAMNVKVSAATEIKIAPTIIMKYGQ